MTKFSARKTYRPFFAAATIAAHASNQARNFRQKDVLFLIDLFSNWVETSSSGAEFSFQATQISRYLDDLADEGLARRKDRSRYPTYSLTRIGLLELLQDIVENNYTSSRGQFFFFFYYIKNYRHLIEHLVEAEGKLFPATLKLQLNELLDAKAFLEREIKSAKEELARLNLRISDTDATASLTRKRIKEGVEFNKIVAEIQKLYPYELNSQKPLTELINELPEEQQRWELESGSYFRSQDMWKPALTQLNTYIDTLNKLLSCL